MKLEAYLEISSEMAQLYDDEVAVSILDTEKVLVWYPSPNLDLKVKVGDPLPKGGIAEQVIRANGRIVKRVPKEVLGIPYVGIGYPIREDGKIAGVAVVTISTAKYDTLVNAGQEILAAVEEISASADNLSASSQELAATVKDMSTETERVITEVKHTGTVTEEIHKISMQSNILGLNASIEAARAGQYGRGFAVVADEVRKMAESTKSSTQEIEADLMAVQNSVGALVAGVHQLGSFTEAQALAAAELNSALGQIAQLAERLVNMGK